VDDKLLDVIENLFALSRFAPLSQAYTEIPNTRAPARFTFTMYNVLNSLLLNGVLLLLRVRVGS